MSLRSRLLLAVLALAAVGLLVANVATYRALESFLTDRIDQQLIELSNPVRGGGPPDGPPGDDRQRFAPQRLPDTAIAIALNGDGEVVNTLSGNDEAVPAVSLPEALPGSSDGGRSTRIFVATAADGTHYRVIARALPQGGTLVIGIELTSLDDTLQQLLVIELVVSGVVLLVMGLAAYWLVRLGLRPLDRMAQTAGEIAEGDLTRRVEPAESKTEIGRLGLALNAMLAQIERAFAERTASEERLRRFATDASHELRTPLTSIRGYAELFRRGAAERPDDLAKVMARIEAESIRMSRLVDDLLLLARLDQGRPLEREPVDLAEIAADAVADAGAVEPDRPVDLEVDGDTQLHGDDGRLRQLVGNLLANARFHTPPGTPVHVRVDGVDGTVRLTVADEGPGFPTDGRERIFERFYRADPARARDTGGTGLGLAIVAAVAEAHGGLVEAGERPGGGASVTVVLPRQPAVS